MGIPISTLRIFDAQGVRLAPGETADADGQRITFGSELFCLPLSIEAYAEGWRMHAAKTRYQEYVLGLGPGTTDRATVIHLPIHAQNALAEFVLEKKARLLGPNVAPHPFL